MNFSLPITDPRFPAVPVRWCAAAELTTPDGLLLATWTELRAQSSRTIPIVVTVYRDCEQLRFTFVSAARRGGTRLNNAEVGGFASLTAAMQGALAHVAGMHPVQLSNPVTGSCAVTLRAGPR